MKLYLILMLAVIAAGVVMFVLERMRNARLRQVGKSAVAMVIDVQIERILRGEATDLNWTDAAERFLYERKITYTVLYTVDGREYTKEWSVESDIQRYKNGDKIDILYNPERPNEMEAADIVDAPPTARVGVIIIAALVLAFILYELFRGR